MLTFLCVSGFRYAALVARVFGAHAKSVGEHLCFSERFVWGSLWPPPNSCKRLSKRRLFARTAIAVLEQSALDRRRGSRSSASRWARTAPRSPSLCLAALQSMRLSVSQTDTS
jgi:hypothetical protein